MARRFEGKSVLLVGASSGIGAELARLLASEGARLVLVARRLSMLQEVADSCATPTGEKPLILEADVADQAAMSRVEERVRSHVGVPDYVIANAGVGVSQIGDRITRELFKQTFDINVIGVGNTLLMFLKDMVARGSGHLVAVSSLASMRGLPTTAAYSASKAAVSTFCEALRIELRGTGVVVTTVQPGFVATPMTEKNGKMPFLLSASQAAEHLARAMLRTKSGVYSFPWQMSLVMRLVRSLPAWIYEPLMGKTVPKRRRGGKGSK